MGKFLVFIVFALTLVWLCFGAPADNKFGNQNVQYQNGDGRMITNSRYEVKEDNIAEEEEEIMKVLGEGTGFGKKKSSEERRNQADINRYDTQFGQEQQLYRDNAELGKSKAESYPNSQKIGEFDNDLNKQQMGATEFSKTNSQVDKAIPVEESAYQLQTEFGLGLGRRFKYAGNEFPERYSVIVFDPSSNLEFPGKNNAGFLGLDDIFESNGDHGVKYM